MSIAVYRNDLFANCHLPVQLMIIHARYMNTLSLGEIQEQDTFQEGALLL